MTAIIPKLKLIYVSIPKCASTSLKQTMFFLENRKIWERFEINGKEIRIHPLYPAHNKFNSLYKKLKVNFDLKEFTKICVVRDPINRIISAYTNKVLHEKRLSETFLKNNGLESKYANPNFCQFVENFELYTKVPNINHHTKPMHEFIGENPSFYDKIYNLKNINEFSELLKLKYDIEFPIPKKQTAGGGSEMIDINRIKEEEVTIYNKLKKITEKDYKIYSDFIG